MQFRRERSILYCSVAVCCFIILYYQYNYAINQVQPTSINKINNAETFLVSSNKYPHTWFQKNCFRIKSGSQLTVENIPSYLKKARLSRNHICLDFAQKFDALFRLEEISGTLKLSPVYLKKIHQYFNNDAALAEQIKTQRIIKVYNRHTHEEMVYNYMRSRRPQTKSEQSAQLYTLKLLEDSKMNCDFCGKNYLNSTAEDAFGRLERPLSYTAANTFKYDRWHTLIVSRNHDTLHLTEEEIGDMFELAKEWFEKAYSIEPRYTCPEMIWDAMPKSGASQIHTHLQVSLGFDIYYGNIERTRHGARIYSQLNNGRNYFNDYLYVHQALGLTIPIGNVHIIAHLTPIKDLEIMILGEELEADFYRALNLVFRTFVDDLQEYSFSLGMYLPPMNESRSKHHEVPISCRLVFRNPVTNLRADMNGLDLYTSSVIGKDRYVLHQQLKQGIAKRQ